VPSKQQDLIDFALELTPKKVAVIVHCGEHSFLIEEGATIDVALFAT